jgi:hypothetical protein
VSRIAADLYSLVPAQFTAARDERARQAKADGQADVATAVRKLSRPTVSAWVVNQLVRSQPAAMRRMFGVADALQHAQRELAGDKLRELSAQRRQVISDLMSDAAATAAASGQRLTEATTAEVRATLEAAIADPQAGAAVRSGQLTRALAYAGLGEVDLAAALAVTPPASRPEAAPSSADSAAHATAVGRGSPPAEHASRTKATAGSRKPAQPVGDSRADDRKAARARALEAAQAEERQAEAAAAAADQAVVSLGEQRQFLRRRIEHLRTEIRDADAQDAALARDEARAKRTRDTAQRTLAAARRRLEQAEARAGSD